MLKRSSLLLITSLVIFTNVTAAHAFHGSQGSSGSLTADTDTHTGSAGFAVPIDVPPGRAGIQPNIQLQYSSSLPDGLLGVGWSLELGSIQRSMKKGVPSYTDSDMFVLVQSGSGQELVFDATAGFYRAKQEGAFMKTEFINNSYWRVTDKKGTRYYFGEDQASREYDPANTALVFKWALNRVEDLNGNTMTITYWRDGNRLYPQYIDYTSNPSNSLASFARVEFLWSARPDTMSGYTAGFLMETNYRLSRVNAWTGTNLQYRFDLTYHASNATGRSLIDTITQYGADGSSTLPPLTFEYQEYVNESAPTYSVNTISNGQQGDNLWNHQTSVAKLQGNYSSRIVAPAEFTWGPVSKKSSGNGRLNLTLDKDYANWFWTHLYSDNAKQLPVSISVSSGFGNVGVWVNGNLSGNVWDLKQGYNRIDITVYRQKLGSIIIGGFIIIEDPTYSFSVDTPIADNVVLMNSDQQNQPLPKFFGDFNGDGRTDKATFDRTAGTISVELSNGMSFAGSTLWLSSVPSDVEILTGNFNADGAADVGFLKKSTGQLDIALAGNNQFSGKTTWITGFGDSDKQVSTGDFNGDGLTDVVEMFNNSGGSLQAQIVLSTGTGFTAINGAVPIISATSGQGLAGDFNGDGLTDLGVFSEGNGYWEIRLNTGDIKAPFVPMPAFGGFGGGKHNVVADFNHDGVTDVGYYDNGSGNIVYRLVNGNTFLPAQTKTLNLSLRNSDVYVQAADLNGDGLPDFAAANTFGAMELAYSNGMAADLLASSDNGVGGTTTITYAPSTTFANPQLPFVLQLVKSANKSNNLGDVYTTRYDYAQGLWDGADREFRGFGLVRTTDPDGNYSETVFAQDGIYKGRVTEQRTYDSSGKLYGKTLHTWAYEEVAAGSNFIYLKRKDNFVYDGDATGRRTAEEFFFGETPQMGNLTKAVQLGEVDLSTGSDTGNDTRAVETAYVQNTSGNNWIVGLPRQTTVKDNAGNIVRQAWFYYDNQGNTTAPVKGILTKKEDWAGTGQVNPVTQYTYDSVGNLLTTTDPKGNVTRVAYDTTYNMFPLATENALGHKVTNEYYGVNGVALSEGGGGFSGLWGQVKSTTDPNQQQGKRSYDAFGRAVAAVSPLDSIAFPTQTTSIEFLGSYTKVTTRQRVEHGKAATVDAVSFIDGFGRLAQTKARSEVTGRYVVNGQARYDSRGLKSRQFLPAFSTNPMDVIDVIDNTKPHTLITYDAMGRPVRTTNPDGTFASVSYDDWAATATDENGHRQRSYFDAYGRLIKKEEYLGADGRSPNYPAKSYALYAATLYTYDSEGNLLQTKDAYNNITTITYDALGRKVAMDDPDMGRWSYQYDLNGNLTKQIDAKGQTLTFTYDALNRLTNKTDGISGTVNVNYTYDNTSSTNAKGRLTQAAYAGGNTQFAYDEMGRELQSIKAMNATNYGVNRSYDALNNLLQIQYPDQKNIYYKYNAAGQIEKISNDPVLLDQQSFNWPEETNEKLASKSEIRNPKSEANSNDQNSNDQNINVLNLENSDLGFASNFVLRASNLSASVVAWLERHILGVSDAYAQAALPPPWVDQDIGSVGVAGSAGYASGTFTVKGSGSDIYNASDSFHFMYQTLNGDGEIIARVESVQNTYSWAKAGVMMRENLTAGSRNAFMLMSATQGAAFQRRKSPASSTSNTSGGTSLRAPYWVKLVRSGNTFTAYKSVDGMAWTQVGPTETITMTQTIYIGLAVTSHANTVLNTSLFSGVQVSTGLAAPVLNTATAGNGEVSLSWSAAAGAAGYRIYYGISPAVIGTVVMDVLNTTSATVRNLTNGTTYYFTVRAYNPAGEGTRSNEMSATPVAPPPPADTTAPGVPGGVTAAAVSTSQIDISWNASTDNVGVTGYRIYRDGAPAGTSATTGYADTGLSAGTTYSYTVSAYDAANNQSAQSGAVNATTPGGGSGAEIIIDDTAAQRAGSWGGPSTSMPNYYQTGYYWNGTKTGTQNIVWRPTIAAAGNYEVFYWLPNGTGTRPTDAGYEIFYGGGSVTKTVNQQEAGGAWKSLGTYPFAAGTNGYVRLNVLTNSGQYTIGDAVKFVAVTAPPPTTVTLTANPATITAGESAALTWSSTNADGCTASGGWSGSKAVSGTANVTPSLTTVYTLTCAGAGGSASASAEVTVNPLVVQETPTLYIKNVDYNAAGQMTKVEYGNGDVTTYAYNPLNLRLTRLYTVDKNGTALQDLNYTYDSVGNILSIDDKVNTADQTFKYDELNRLTEAAGQGYGTKTYVYDTIGNIVQKDGKTYFYGDGTAAGPHAVTSLSDGTTFTYDANGNLTQQTQSTQSTQYTYDAENRLVKVTKNGSTIGQYEYDGDGGRTKKTATVGSQTTTTTFVGSLFETSGSRNTKFIFLGGQRVAAVTNSPSIGSTTLYYHADHLGGANVLTDATGFKKELIEYEPFGQESRHEKYGSSEEVAWYYFTGKPKDDETGLIYFGARYYDPALGRFITADTIVPYPTNPQAFNRYSYAGNNPVSHLEDGHGWWKKAWKNFVHALRHPFDIEGQWKNLVGEAKDPDNGPIVSGLTAFVFSGFNPVVGISAALTSYSLSTPPGQKLTNWVANEIYDDILGFSPRTAYMLAYIDLIMTGTYLSERAFANILADPVQINGNLTDAQIEELRKNGQFVGDENVFGPSLKAKGAFEKNNVKGLMQDGKLVGSFQKRTLDVPGLRQLGAQHSSANVLTVSASASKLNPWRYATWGVCHQATNATLLNGGISSTILNLGPSWDMFVTTAVYGNYGGQLGARTLSGINANRDYYERQK